MKGINSTNRNLLVIILAAILLLFGPIEPYGMVVRTAYTIILPTLLWLYLKYFGHTWEADESDNDRLNRAIVAMIAGALFVGAYLNFTATYHSECTQYARSGDGGHECVGDYATASGPNKVGGVMSVGFGIAAAWYAISKKSDSKVDKKN